MKQIGRIETEAQKKAAQEFVYSFMEHEIATPSVILGILYVVQALIMDYEIRMKLSAIEQPSSSENIMSDEKSTN